MYVTDGVALDTHSRTFNWVEIVGTVLLSELIEFVYDTITYCVDRGVDDGFVKNFPFETNEPEWRLKTYTQEVLRTLVFEENNKFN